MARGGYRPGAGRPKGAKTIKDLPLAKVTVGMSPLEYMLSVMNDSEADSSRRDRMAQAAAPFVHARAGEGTKRDDTKDKAKRAAQGRFAPKAPPKLVVSNG